MKKILPITKNPLGFTLIELLVVVSILAVLAVIGFAVFSGLTGRGNDSRRSADVKSFGDAMEVKRGNNPNYVVVAATDFAGGAFPHEPTSREEKYCYKDGTEAIPNTEVDDWNSLGTGSAAGCPSTGNWTNADGKAPTVTSGATFFKFCTLNEKKDGVICVGSRQ